MSGQPDPLHDQPERPAGPVPDGISRRAFVGVSAAMFGAFLADGLPLPNPMNPRTEADSNPSEANALSPVAFRSLPLGSIRARGWLLRLLELQRDGLTGHAETVLPATGPDSAWKGGNGEDWEKGPYYLKGLIPLAYTLNDESLKARANAWIEPILASQREDGFFGPSTNDDWWPRMVVTYLLRDHHEATGDPRVLPFLSRYYAHMARHLPDRPLGSWGRARAGDEIDTVMWLYERIGDAALLGLCDLLARQAYPWTDIFHDNRFLEFGDDFHPKHNVNVPQALKLPVVISRRTGLERDRTAYRAGVRQLMRDHGTSFGLWSGSEMVSGRSTVAGVETCSIVEYMLSAQTAIRVLGDPQIGDELEQVAFNALPAAMSKDFRQHVYYTTANNVAAVRGVIGYQDDHGDDRVLAPRAGFPCCCYNLHMGWPKLAQSAWANTPDGGLAALVYVPSEVSATVRYGATVRIVCDTEYPFEESVGLRIHLAKGASFPLHLRIPGWCDAPAVRVNGDPVAARAGEFVVIDRTWQDGDRIELRFPMRPQIVAQTNGWASVELGPLVFALGLDERWDAFERREDGFDSFEVTSATPWNYALVPERGLEVERRPAVADNPFRTGAAPVTVRAAGVRAEAWRRRFDDRLPLDPPLNVANAPGAEERLTLVPFGSQMLRISIFPVVGTPQPPRAAWSEDFVGDWQTRLLVFRGAAVRDGRLRLPHAAKAVALPTDFADFTYEGDVALGDKGDAGFIFRVTEPSVGPDHYCGYYLGLSAERGELVFGLSANAWRRIATRPIPIRPDRSYRVRIAARGPRIQAWVDDMTTPIVVAEDTAFTRGSLGVRSYANTATFGRLSAEAHA
ncbi:MAG: glycoside hydrolase family 127 protein [Fimbriimonadaceae bacterium]|nr:glycoside hydrolase family 127 protein [Fimbriimonadaceae bacterium]